MKFNYKVNKAELYILVTVVIGFTVVFNLSSSKLNKRLDSDLSKLNEIILSVTYKDSQELKSSENLNSKPNLKSNSLGINRFTNPLDSTFCNNTLNFNFDWTAFDKNRVIILSIDEIESENKHTELDFNVLTYTNYIYSINTKKNCIYSLGIMLCELCKELIIEGFENGIYYLNLSNISTYTTNKNFRFNNKPDVPIIVSVEEAIRNNLITKVEAEKILSSK